MGKAIRESRFNIPPEQLIPSTEYTAPFVIVGDQAFPLLVNLMRPFPEKQVIVDSQKEEFNYRLSRARRVSENAFGITTSLFPIFSRPIDLRSDDTRNNLIVSSCILHNMIRDESADFFLKHKTNDTIVDLEQNELMANNNNNIENQIISSDENVIQTTSQMNSAIKARETFVHYFSSQGALKWRNQNNDL